MTNEWQRAIRAECNRLTIAFAVYLDSRQYDKVVSLFTHDAIYNPRGIEFVGKEGILGYLRARPQARRTRHVISNHLVDVLDEKSATGSCVLTYYVDEGGEAGVRSARLAGPELVGDYYDQYVLTDDGWRIARRIGAVIFQVRE